MDLKAKSWVGNIYQRFETMCLEMEEAMYQDTVKYVGKVKTVGTSVKRFYSEVMQDLHRDPVEVAATDLSLNPCAHNEIDKKLKAKLKGYSRGIINKFSDDAQVIKGKNQCGGVYRRQNGGMKGNAGDNHLPLRKSDSICLASGDAIKLSSGSEVRRGFEMTSEHMTTASPLTSVKGCDYREAARKVCNSMASKDVSSANTSINGAAVESLMQKQADIGLSSDSHERSAKSCSTISKKHVKIESGSEIVEQFDESKLEDTRILVDEDKLHVAQSPVKQKSYKEVFCTKNRSATKDYEKLGELYGDNQQFNLEAEDKVLPFLAMNSNSNKLTANDHFESDWELL